MAPVYLARDLRHERDVALTWALDYARRHGVIHRDVEPANIHLDGRSWT